MNAGKNMKYPTGNSRGITLIELILVIFLVALLSYHLFPLIKTTYNSWRITDRRVELLEVGRVGMSKMGRELRKAYDLYSCSDTTYIDYYPDWASDTRYRFNYDASAGELEFGTQTPAFINDSLAEPIDSFAYVAYSRRMATGVTRHRVVNSFRFVFEVSDERQILPTNLNLNPMQFRTHVQLRTSRAGYAFARTSAYASETYRYSRGAGDSICIKAFCDRVNRELIITNQAVISCFFCPGWPNSWTITLPYVATDDYYSACTNINAANIRTGFAFVIPSHRVKIQIVDANGENCVFADAVKIAP